MYIDVACFRAPPGISIHDYLQRLTTHATLSPPILLSMVYYIDRLCALYPAFIISSLTVHRFLIASATVASKGLSDCFWTNATYARVGGISLRELALLEMEFLVRVQWRIVPKPEVLVDYYRSLVERSDGYVIEGGGGGSSSNSNSNSNSRSGSPSAGPAPPPRSSSSTATSTLIGAASAAAAAAGRSTSSSTRATTPPGVGNHSSSSSSSSRRSSPSGHSDKMSGVDRQSPRHV